MFLGQHKQYAQSTAKQYWNFSCIFDAKPIKLCTKANHHLIIVDNYRIRKMNHHPKVMFHGVGDALNSIDLF